MYYVTLDALEQNLIFLPLPGTLSTVLLGEDCFSCAGVSLCVEMHAVVFCMGSGLFLLNLPKCVPAVVYPECLVKMPQSERLHGTVWKVPVWSVSQQKLVS